ncbi:MULTISPECIES: hypothetical protein, partial [unclassified Bradyrhizobium]|uniref:hypothetical protein n=1 Tax=unclassified Bradyrhizobium TaxID=2631580 RepID=UPI001FF89CC2
TTKAPRARYLIDCGRTNAGQRQMENRELAQRDGHTIATEMEETSVKGVRPAFAKRGSGL